MACQDKRKQLLHKLKKEHCFWSYDKSKMKSISDESLIEYVLLYLDIDDINQLFPLFGFKKVKRIWLDRVAPLGAMFRPFNILYAWYYFDIKRPEAYVKSIETRHMNRMISAAMEHSDHKLRSRGLLSMLTTGRNFVKEKGFSELLPVYDVTPMEIQEYIKEKLKP